MKNCSSLLPISIKGGLGLGSIYIVYQVIRKALGIHYINSGFNQLFMLCIFALAIVLTIYAFRKKNNGLTLWQAIRSGIIVSGIASVSLVLYTVVLTSIIEPNYYQAYTEHNRERHIQGNPNRSPEQIEIDLQEGLSSLSTDVQKIFFFSLIGGLIIAFPAGLVMQKRKPHKASL